MTPRRATPRRATVLLVAVIMAAGTAAAAAPTPTTPTTDTIAGAATVSAPAQRLARPARTMLVALGGDVLNESAVNLAGAAAARPGQRYDFAPVFAPVAPVIAAADLAICHAELPIGAPGERVGLYGRSPYGGNLLLAPNELARGLADTGFDRCSTSSNHSFDTGVAGIVSTLDALDAAGISHVGTARTAEEAAAQVFTVNGIRVAHLAYTRTSNTVPPRDAWMLHRALSVNQVATDVRSVRAAGAEIVLVSLHLGTEMQREPTATDRQFATQLTGIGGDAHIDLLVHHGPHVVQPLELVNNTFVYWSVGNFVSGMGTAGSGRYADQRTLDGLLATARFTETTPGVFHVDPWPVVVCTSKLDRSVTAGVSALADPAWSAAAGPARLAEIRACVSRASSTLGRVN
jgi:poly-gamma-glutamate capsule biosynthesis protein CapA/YwtB (metallophosphatase superfamily)